jgi:pentatricopeptide repeat protein
MRFALPSSAAAISVLQHAKLRPAAHAPSAASSLTAVAVPNAAISTSKIASSLTAVTVPDAAIDTDKISELHQLTGQHFSLSSRGQLEFNSTLLQQTIPEQRTLAYNELITVCSEKKQWDAVAALWQSLLAEGLLPSEQSCENAIRACTRPKQPPAAVLRVFGKLIAVQPQPSVFALQSAVHAASRVADAARMQKIIALHDTSDEHNRLPTWAYLTALRTFSDASMQQESLSMLNAVLSTSSDAATRSKAYKAALNACRKSKSGDYTAALALLRQMEEHSVPVDGAHYSAVMTTVTHTTAGKTWQRETSPERCAVVAELWHEMQRKGFPPSASSCRTAAAAFHQLQQPQHVLVRWCTPLHLLTAAKRLHVAVQFTARCVSRLVSHCCVTLCLRLRAAAVLTAWLSHLQCTMSLWIVMLCMHIHAGSIRCAADSKAAV